MKNMKDSFVSLWSCTYSFREALREDSKCKVLDRIKEGNLSSLWDASNDNNDEKLWVWKDVALNSIPIGGDLHLCLNLTGESSSCPSPVDIPHLNEVLPRLMLPPTREVLFNEDTLRESIIWVTFMLFDEKAKKGEGTYIYRNVMNIEDDLSAKILSIMYRSPEIGDLGHNSFFRDYCLDFSNMMRDQVQPNFTLVTSDNSEIHNKQLYSIQINSLIGKPNSHFVGDERLREGGDDEIVSRASNLRNKIKIYLSSEKGNDIAKKLAKYSIDKLDIGAINEINELNEKIGSDDLQLVFFKDSIDFEKTEQTPIAISLFIENELCNIIISNIHDVKQENKINEFTKSIEQDRWKLANYFIWLVAIHPDLDSYIVRHVFDFRRENEARRRIVRPSGIVVAVRANSDLSSIAARSEILIHELFSPLTSYYAWDNLVSSTKNSVLTDYAKGAAHGFKNALMLPGFYLDGQENVIANIIEDEEDSISSGSVKKLRDMLKDINVSKMLIDQLNQQAQLFFWVMAPDRYADEKRDPRQQSRWPERDCDTILSSSYLTAMSIVLSTLPDESFAKRGLCKEAIKKIARNSVVAAVGLSNENSYSSLCTKIGDIARQIPLFTTSIEIPPELQNHLKLKSVERGAIEGILAELFQNAIRVVLLDNYDATIRFGIIKEGNSICIYISNTARFEDAIKLRDAISKDRTDSYSASGGIRGLRQITAFERELLTDLHFEIIRPNLDNITNNDKYVEVIWKMLIL